MTNELDHYQVFLARRRYERALRLPWFIMSTAGSGMLMLYVYELLAFPLILDTRHFVNPIFGGLAVAAGVAIWGFAGRTTQRWPAIIVITALIPTVLLVVELLRTGKTIFAKAPDWLFVIALVTMVVTALYAFVRRDPVLPPAGDAEIVP